MATLKYKCVGQCGKEFAAGDWFCFSGEKHRVALKAYYLADCPADKRDGAYSRTIIENIPPERQDKDQDTGKIVIIPGGQVIFVRGKYSTDDPATQFYLDKRGIDVGETRWKQAYQTDAQKQLEKDNELKEREARITRQENDLLAQLKDKSKKPELVTR